MAARYTTIDTSIAATVTPIRAVAPQPAIVSRRFARKRPITCSWVAISIIMIMTGTATMPLMTALQISMRIGSSDVKVKPKPIAVAAAMML